jgi:RNA polymerase-binding transcription factor DksA
MIPERSKTEQAAKARSSLDEQMKRRFRRFLKQAEFEECDVCPNSFEIQRVELAGNLFLCAECQNKFPPTATQLHNAHSTCIAG